MYLVSKGDTSKTFEELGDVISYAYTLSTPEDVPLMEVIVNRHRHIILPDAHTRKVLKDFFLSRGMFLEFQE